MPSNSSKEAKQGTPSFNIREFIVNRKKTFLVLGLALIILSTLLFIVFNRGSSDKIILKIGDDIVLRSEYTKLVDEAKMSGIKESSSRSIIIEYFKDKASAKHWDIDLKDIDIKSVTYSTASDMVDIKDQAQNSIATDKIISDDSEVFQMAKYSKALQVQLYARSVEGMQVALYRIPNINNLDPNGKTPLSEEDIEIGRGKANQLRSDLINGTTSTYDTLDKILKDPDYRMLGNSNGSGMFYYSKSNKLMTYMSGNENNSNMGVVPPTDVVTYLDSVESTGISDVLGQTMYDSRIDQEMLGAFFFVEVLRINSPEEGESPESTSAEYEDFKNNIRVVEYEN